LQNVCGRYWKTLVNSPVLTVMLRKNSLCLNSAVPEYIGETGFSVVESVTIRICRYMEISGHLTIAARKSVQKSATIFWYVNGWTCIAKTMLYRQLNYFQYFIDIPQSYLKPVSDIISTYVCGNLNLASNRLYLPAYMGGLGLFEIETFLAAQKRSWIQCS
jgi:hypothetical protein